MRIEKPVMLVGLMGSGKTTIGIALAKRLDLKFVDSDRVIEEQAGVSIAEIFERDGEDFFRKVERKVIRRILKSGEKLVLATGGGAFMNEKTRKTAKKYATTIWLEADIDNLLERVEGSTNRPLLNNKNRRRVLQELILQRYPVYADAEFKVNVNNLSRTKIVNEILRLLRQPLP